MTNKKIIINDIDVNALNSDEIACMNRYEVAHLFVKIVERLVAKEQENEELRQYHNKCCEEFEKEKKEWLEKYNQISRGFYNGDYCNTEWCSLLKAKEQECNKLYIQLKADEEYHKEEENTLRKIIKNKEERNIELYKENNQLKVNNEKMSKGYAELLEIVSPYIDDFTGYNEKLGGFDIVLCVKELLQQLDSLKAQNDTYKKMLEDEEVRFALNEVRTGERHLWFNKAEKLEQTLIEIKDIAENVIKNVSDKCIETTPMYGVHKQILQKISEVLNEQ